jgi:hypothetical protein
VHPSTLVALRHLLMKYSASGRHPLNVTGSQRATISQTVTVVNRACEDIRNGFDPAMWMPGETGEKVFGILVAEVVEQKEWIEFRSLPETKRATQFYARAFDGGL